MAEHDIVREAAKAVRGSWMIEGEDPRSLDLILAPFFARARQEEREEALAMAYELIAKTNQLVAATREAVLEEAATLAENPYCDAVEAYGNDEPLTVGGKLAIALRALRSKPKEPA